MPFFFFLNHFTTTYCFLLLLTSRSAHPPSYGQVMGTLLLDCLLPLDPAKRLFQLLTPKFENMKAPLLLAPGNLISQPTTPFIDTFLNLFFFSLYYKYSNSCQKLLPAASNHMLTGPEPIWERLSGLVLIFYRELLHPGAAPAFLAGRTAGTRRIPTKVMRAILAFHSVTSESSPQSPPPLTWAENNSGLTVFFLFFVPVYKWHRGQWEQHQHGWVFFCELPLFHYSSNKYLTNLCLRICCIFLDSQSTKHHEISDLILFRFNSSYTEIHGKNPFWMQHNTDFILQWIFKYLCCQNFGVIVNALNFKILK